MIYALSGTSQTRLSARVSIEKQHHMFTLAQRHHIITLVDRAVMEDGITLNRAADNLLVSAKSVRRWRRAAFQDTTNHQGRDTVRNHRCPAGYMDDIQEELIAFVTDWRDRGMPVTRFALVRKIGSLKPAFVKRPQEEIQLINVL